MKRSIKLQRVFKISEYNSLTVSHELLEIEDHGQEELVKEVFRYLAANINEIGLEYVLQQSKLAPMTNKEALEFCRTEQIDAINKIQSIIQEK